MKHSVSLAIGTLLLLSAANAAADRKDDGKAAYDAHCATCHETGADGAPRTRQADDWAGRSDLWESVLFEHAEKGYLKMPAKGGAESLSDYEVEAAAEYMLNVTYPGRLAE